MNIADAFVAELTQEGAGTRRALERIPDALLGWQPHTKSMSMGRLASHMAEIPKWMVSILSVDEYVMDMESYEPYVAASTAELVQVWDANLALGLEKLKGMSDDDMLRMWQMRISGNPVLEMPKLAVVRSMILNHLIHHRGQLTVYLRLNDVAVPALYGPSADENPM